MEVAPTSLITLLILGIVIRYVSFFPSERERTRAEPERCHGQAKIYCPLCFWVSSCPHPASARSVGLPSCLQWVGLERREATLSASGQA